MKKSLLKVAALAVVALFCAVTVATAETSANEDPVGKFFRRLFGWPAKTAYQAGKTGVETTVEAGKTGVKTVESTGKVLVGKETPEKLVTTPIEGVAKTGAAAVVGTAKTVETAVTECPIVPEKKSEEPAQK